VRLLAAPALLAVALAGSLAACGGVVAVHSPASSARTTSSACSGTSADPVTVLQQIGVKPYSQPGGFDSWGRFVFATFANGTGIDVHTYPCQAKMDEEDAALIHSGVPQTGVTFVRGHLFVIKLYSDEPGVLPPATPQQVATRVHGTVLDAGKR
jgi:hypothetical protein